MKKFMFVLFDNLFVIVPFSSMWLFLGYILGEMIINTLIAIILGYIYAVIFNYKNITGN